MAFKMGGFSAYDKKPTFTKHDGPHPVSGMIQYDEGMGK